MKNSSNQNSQVEQLEDFNMLFTELLEEAEIIGQVFATYWILETVGEMFLIDQHAAHERVNYYDLMKKYRKAEVRTQQVIPYTLELDSAGLTAVKDHLELLSDCGLELDFFGKNTLLVRAIPFAIKDVFDDNAIFDLIDQIVQHPTSQLDIKTLEEMLIMVACKKSVKANQKMSKQEFDNLLHLLADTPNAFTCPHGRPTIVKMTKGDVERLFYRS